MTPRERQLATIRRQPTDRVSTDVIGIENLPEIAALLGIDQEQVLDHLGIDGRLIAAWYTGELLPSPNGMRMTEWGIVDSGDYGSSHQSPLAEMETIAEIERYPYWPDPAQYHFPKAAQLARDFAPRYAVRGPYWRPLFCQVCDLFGMEEAMVKMAVEPALFEAALERVFHYTLEYCRRLLDACGDALDILCLGDDFATQRGLMISPAQWRQFLKPRYAQLFALGKERGKPVWFHSCGDVTSVLPDLIDIGVDVWETVQLHTLPMTPEALKREFGRELTFFGGISTQRLPFATPEEVREEVRRCIDVLGKDGGYICGPDHHIKPDVPPANTVALFESARQYSQG